MKILPPIVDAVRIPLNPQHRKRLQSIDDEDFSDIASKVIDDLEELGKGITGEELHSRLFGLKQYYAIVLLDPYNSHAVSVEVDKCWHTHLLHTHQYQNFCHNLMGAFIHHIPLNRHDPRQMENIKDVYGHTLETLHSVFGEVNPLVWTNTGQDNQFICWGGSRAAPQEVLDIAVFPRTERGQSFMLENMNRHFPAHAGMVA